MIYTKSIRLISPWSVKIFKSSIDSSDRAGGEARSYGHKMQKSTQTQKISLKMYLSTTGHVAGKLNIGLSTVEATYLVFRCVASSFDVYVCKLIYSKFL